MVNARLPQETEWEKPYLEAIVNALRPHGEVLEVGFESGFAATLIQRCSPKKQTIIESHAKTAHLANEWSRGHKDVCVIEGTWQQTLPKLGVFDAIFFNERSLESLSDRTQKQQAGNLALKKGKETFAFVDEKLPGLQEVRYSDQDIEKFYEIIGKRHRDQMSYFISELKMRGQISKEQYEKYLQAYSLQRTEVKAAGIKVPKRTDPVFLFLKECLQKHMKKGSRLSCFFNDPISKYEDPLFFEEVITNPAIDYQEHLISIKSSELYPFHEALVMVIEKL